MGQLTFGHLADRYVRSHAPATDRDLAKWAGIPLTAARQALRDGAAPTPTSARCRHRGCSACSMSC